MQKRKIVVLLAALIFVVIIFALFKFLFVKDGAEQAPIAGREIRLGYITADQLHSPAVMVMKERRLLEAAGFTVKWTEYLAGAFAMHDMIDGKIDFACCGVVPVMTTHAQNMKLAIIAGANQEGASLVVDNSINTVMDLNNKRIATPGAGSIQDAMLAQVAADNNIRIRHMSMNVTDMPVFLQRGEINGFIAWAPHPSAAEAQKLGHELLSSRDMMAGHQCCVLATSQDFMQNEPAVVENVLDIYHDAYKWFMANTDESIKMVAKATGKSEDIIRIAINTVSYPYPPFCDRANMRNMAQNLIEIGRITSVKSAELDSFIESLYKPAMLEKISGLRQPAP